MLAFHLPPLGGFLVAVHVSYLIHSSVNGMRIITVLCFELIFEEFRQICDPFLCSRHSAWPVATSCIRMPVGQSRPTKPNSSCEHAISLVCFQLMQSHFAITEFMRFGPDLRSKGRAVVHGGKPNRSSSVSGIRHGVTTGSGFSWNAAFRLWNCFLLLFA